MSMFSFYPCYIIYCVCLTQNLFSFCNFKFDSFEIDSTLVYVPLQHMVHTVLGFFFSNFDVFQRNIFL